MTRLDELDKTEMWDLARKLSPAMTWEEFSLCWTEFQAEKAQRALS